MDLKMLETIVILITIISVATKCERRITHLEDDVRWIKDKMTKRKK